VLFNLVTPNTFNELFIFNSVLFIETATLKKPLLIVMKFIFPIVPYVYILKSISVVGGGAYALVVSHGGGSVSRMGVSISTTGVIAIPSNQASNNKKDIKFHKSQYTTVTNIFRLF
jgi:hypothetical protein